MSYFEDQEEVWYANNCQGDISDVDPYDPDWKPKRVASTQAVSPIQPKRTKSQKRNAQRKAAKLRKASEVRA